jgi:hypothetical protein
LAHLGAPERFPEKLPPCIVTVSVPARSGGRFAIGTATSGITLVCGENVCGIDPQLVLDAQGKNIGEWIKAGTLPKTVNKFGSKVDEIFVSYEELKAKFGKDVEKLPLGAVGIYTASQKIRTGLQQSRTAPSTSRRSRAAT